MKTPFAFANWNMIIGFLLSWAVWVLLEHTALEYGWITTKDGFIIVSIFTATSYLRSYVLSKIFHNNIKQEVNNDNQ